MDRIRGIIFDIDGTLVDSMHVWTESDEIILSRRGIAYTDEISFALKSLNFLSACEYLKNTYGLPETKEEIAAEITDIVRDKYFNEVSLTPFAKEFVEYCRKNGIRMCCATSNSRELAEGVLKSNGILEDMEFILISEEIGSDKDNPEIFIQAEKKLGIRREELCVIEDSPHAAKTTKALGIFTVGVNNGHFGDFEALGEYADIRTENFGELMNKYNYLFER